MDNQLRAFFQSSLQYFERTVIISHISLIKPCIHIILEGPYENLALREKSGQSMAQDDALKNLL